MEKEADHIGKKHAQAKVGATASASGTVQKAPVEDEELLQGQPEEEELQMQPDAGNVVQREEDEEELQMQPEEEELQMQPDAGNVVQREEVEEELQMQPEEEELQMQPDTGNVVQRDWEDGVFDKGKLNYKKYSKSVLGGQRIAPGISKQVAMFGGGIGQTKKTDDEPSPKAPTVTKKVLSRPKPKVTVNKPQISDNTTGTDTKDIGKSTTWKKGVVAKTDSHPDPKVGKRKPPPLPTKPKPKWVRGVKPSENIPEAPPLPSINEKKQGSPLSFSDQIKAKSKSMRTNTQRENLAKLDQDRQQKVGTRVSEQYMEDQANKPKSKMDKFKGFLSGMGGKLKKYGGMAGKAALGKVSGMVKGQLSEGKDHFLGKSDKKEETAAPATSPVTVNVGGGGGGGGGGGMAETISDLFQENKKLKAQIAELEKEKV